MTDYRKSTACMLTAALMFSLNETAYKLINGALNSVQFNALRYLIAGSVLLPMTVSALKKSGKKIPTRQLLEIFVIAFIGVTVCGPCYQMSIGKLGAASSGVLFSVNPLIITLLGAALLREAVQKKQWIALVLDIIGILIIVNPFHMTASPEGLLLMAIAVLTYSVYGVLSKRYSPVYGSLAVTCISNLMGGVQLAVLIALSYLAPVGNFFTAIGLPNYARIPVFQGYSLSLMPWVLFSSVGVCGVGLLMWFRSMELGTVQLASVSYFIKPVLSPLLSLLILGETVTPSMWVGIAFMVAGAGTAILPIGRKKQ